MEEGARRSCSHVFGGIRAMGRGRRGSGVELRENSVRISFTWQGERCRETLDLTPTPSHEKYAARLVDEIHRRIDAGTFRYGDSFFRRARVRSIRSLRESNAPSDTIVSSSSTRKADRLKRRRASTATRWSSGSARSAPTDSSARSRTPSSPRWWGVIRGPAGSSATTT